MGYYDRMGTEGYRKPGFLGGLKLFPPVIRWLFLLNGGIFLLFNFILAPFTIDGVPLGGRQGVITYFFLSLWPLGSTNFLPWQLFTYMFVHAGFFHILFNMFALWMFGMELENLWGSRKFLVYYLLCGLGGGIAHLLVGLMSGQVGVPTVGASGAVFGILTAFGFLFPNRRVYLYFLVPIEAKYFIMGWIGLELFYGVLGTSDGIAHFAHLGGAAVGFLYLLNEKGSLPFSGLATRFGFRNPFGKTERVEGDHGMRSEVRDARFYDIRTGRRMESENDQISQDVIDAILDKITTGGYQSLNEEEKRILNEASKRMN